MKEKGLLFQHKSTYIDTRILQYCNYMTLLNYRDKKVKNVRLNSKCHLGNVMPGSIFYTSMALGIIRFSVAFLKAVLISFKCYDICQEVFLLCLVTHSIKFRKQFQSVTKETNVN